MKVNQALNDADPSMTVVQCVDGDLFLSELTCVCDSQFWPGQWAVLFRDRKTALHVTCVTELKQKIDRILS